jgi:hypothetical protein
VADNLPAHSKLGASSYHRWKACPGSVREAAKYPSIESGYAAEGTAAHEMAARLLQGLLTPGFDESVQVYVDFVKACAKSSLSQLYVETKFDLRHYHPALFGTADAVIYQPQTKNLIVVDYKHGQGVAVEAFQNEQLAYYALGALHQFALPVSTIEMVIVQPRCFHPDGPIRSWTVDALQILDFANDLIVNAKRTEAPDAPLNPGDHCRWCAAKPHCAALREKSLTLAKQAFRNDVAYSPQRLSETLHMLPAMEQWIKGVREFAYHEVQAGREIPGWKLVDKIARRKWREDVEVAEWLFAQTNLKVDDVFERVTKSPAQVEKVLDKKYRPILDELTVKESSGTTLVPDSDKRPKSQNTKPQITDAFSVITDEGDL